MKSALLSCLFLLCVQFAARPGIPEPDNVVYGQITLGGSAVTAANSSVFVEARRLAEGPAIASYQMGSAAEAGDYYSLRISVESLPPVTDASASQAGQTLFIVVRDDSGVRDQKSIVVGARGKLTLLNFGTVDSDHNGLNDDWEVLYFHSTGIDPNADPDHDGRTNLQEMRDGTNPLAADTGHPADNNPTNNIISINEVTAYGLAWKTGKPWPIAPTNIPIDYVTRAGTLWKGGEAYKVDTNASPTAPLWWVNVSTPPAGSSAAGAKIHSASVSTSSITRTSQNEGGVLTVTLTVQPAEGVQAWALAETVPSGMVAGTISEGGELASGGQLRWGPYFDHEERTLTYQLTPGAGAADLIAFSGVGSFDGGSEAITGRTELSRNGAGVRLGGAVAPGKAVDLVLTGEPGLEYALEVSKDLIHWKELGRLTPDASGALRFADDEAGEAENRFYRARRAQ